MHSSFYAIGITVLAVLGEAIVSCHAAPTAIAEEPRELHQDRVTFERTGTAPAPKLTVRAATAAGDTVWVKVAYQLPGSFALGDTVVVDYYRPSTTWVFNQKTRTAVDSAQMASLVAAGGTQTFRACTSVKRGTLTSGIKCSSTVSWTRPATVVTAPPSVTNVALGTPVLGATSASTPITITPAPDDGKGAVSFIRSWGANAGGGTRTDTTTAVTGTLTTSPLPADSASYFVCVNSWRNGLTSTSSVCRSWWIKVPPDTTTTPTVQVLGLFPGTCTGGTCPWNTTLVAAAMTTACQSKVTAGTVWQDAAKATPVTECRDSMGRPMVAQYCTYTKWSDGYWTHDISTASAPRCTYVKDSLGTKLQPWLATRLASRPDLYGRIRAIQVATR